MTDKPDRRTAAALVVGAIVVSAALALPGSAVADPPFNDAFTSADPLSGTRVDVGGSNVEATKEPGEPNHGGDVGGASVWFTWTAPSTGPVTVDTCGSDFDTLLSVYTGTAVDSLTELASNDQRCGDQSVVEFDATEGTEYRIAVDGWSNGGSATPASGYVSLKLYAAPPDNDDFASATELVPEVSTGAVGDNVNATTETGEPNHDDGAAGSSVWFNWVAPESGPFRVGTCQSLVDTVVGVYTGDSVDSLTKLASNDNFCGDQSSARFNAIAGTTYRIAVDGSSFALSQNLREGLIVVELNPAQIPPNDAFAGAQDLSAEMTIGAGGLNLEASAQAGEPAHAGIAANASLWYRWQAPSYGPTLITTCAPGSLDSVLAVYTGSALNALTPIVANNDDPDCFLSSEFSTVEFNATAGTVYWIAVDGVQCCGRGRADFTLELSHTAQPPPPPDEQPANQPPETTIVKGPKKKTSKRAASFAFTSSEPGSSFECKLDTGDFDPCTSPRKVKVKKGKHTFQVRAVDAEGAVDPTPAARAWKVKKRKRR